MMLPESLLAVAYALTWILVAGYLVRLARRQIRLETEVRALRAEIDRTGSRSLPTGSDGAPQPPAAVGPNDVDS